MPGLDYHYTANPRSIQQTVAKFEIMPNFSNFGQYICYNGLELSAVWAAGAPRSSAFLGSMRSIVV